MLANHTPWKTESGWRTLTNFLLPLTRVLQEWSYGFLIDQYKNRISKESTRYNKTIKHMENKCSYQPSMTENLSCYDLDITRYGRCLSSVSSDYFPPCFHLSLNHVTLHNALHNENKNNYNRTMAGNMNGRIFSHRFLLALKKLKIIELTLNHCTLF